MPCRLLCRGIAVITVHASVPRSADGTYTECESCINRDFDPFQCERCVSGSRYENETDDEDYGGYDIEPPDFSDGWRDAVAG